MKIKDVRKGQRVEWRGRGGEVLYVQPDTARDTREVTDAMVHACMVDYGSDRFDLMAPHGGHLAIDLKRRRVLVRLDREAMTGGRHTYLADTRYLWCTPRALQPEVER